MSDKPSAEAIALIDSIARVVQEHTLSNGSFDYEVRDETAKRIEAYAAERVWEAVKHALKVYGECKCDGWNMKSVCEMHKYLDQLERER